MGIWRTASTSCLKATGYPRPQKTTITEFGYSATKLFMMGMTALMMRMKRISFFPRKLLPLQISIAADAAVPPPAKPQQRPAARSAQPAQRSTGQSSSPPEKRSAKQPETVFGKPEQAALKEKKGFDPYDLLRPAVIFLIILVIVLAAMGLFKLFGGKNDKKETSAPSSSPEVTTEATVAPEPATEPEPSTEAPEDL